MGTKAIDPQSIRNVTLIGDPDETTRVAHRLRRSAPTGSNTIHWALDHADHMVRVTELSIHAPMAELERGIRVADGIVVLVDATLPRRPRLETTLRVADDHQVARLCLLHGLDRPGADYDRCLRTITETRGATPLKLQLPLGAAPGFEPIIDLPSLWAFEPLAAEIYGPHWQLAEQSYRALMNSVLAQDPTQLHHRIRSLTRIGDVIPILCGTAIDTDDTTRLLDAIVRYLPSPLDVCQPEHALDY
ncbi:hypothetical protein GPX89_40080 [Nocardia sp. ET3-3]|uniref:Tr-type G domain-containing protein n=1 Tax=Nocardia terrae TaxID=2675851 RepID=A0A7K1V9V1_9NOCA|nr:GTP-binding protein [Nocardia terrae]MVU83424.1 hypothetical protein [Nocardia terrae]